MKFNESLSLKPYHYLKMEVCFKYTFELHQAGELSEIINFSHQKKLPLFFLGEGSNIFFKSDQYDMICIRNCLSGIEIIKEEESFIYTKVFSGEILHQFIDWTLSNQLYGLENLTLIPGTLGAALVQNAGAYGVEIKQCVHQVEVFDSLHNLFFHLSLSECEFSYRKSIFQQKPHWFIVNVTLKLSKKFTPNISYPDLSHYYHHSLLENISPKDLSTYIQNIRRKKLEDPSIYPNVGSFFCNPIIESKHYQNIQAILEKYRIPVYPIENNQYKISAAAMIDALEWKGKRIGNLGVSKKHALIIISYGESTGKELLSLANAIQDNIKNVFAIDLRIEPTII